MTANEPRMTDTSNYIQDAIEARQKIYQPVYQDVYQAVYDAGLRDGMAKLDEAWAEILSSPFIRLFMLMNHVNVLQFMDIPITNVGINWVFRCTWFSGILY